MVIRKAFGIAMTLTLLLSVAALAAQAAPKGSQQTPRNETLYMNGLQWGTPSNFNMLSSNPAWPCNQNRFLIYESLFMYDQMKGTMDPLLAKSLNWIDDYTLDVTMNPAARFNDGQALTNEDVAYSFELGKKYTISWSNVWLSLESVTAKPAGIVEFKLAKDNYNRLNVLDALTNVPIHPKHVWTKIEADNDNDIAKITTVFNEDPVASGPYKVYYWNDTKIIVVRDDNYWGKALFGRLPAPKYVTHVIFKSADAGNLALKNGEVDMSQQFIPKVWLMWKDGAPIRTYLPKLPYFIPASMPQIFFNMTRKGLDVPEVRRALALSIDYKKVADVAMSGYSDPIVPGIILGIPSETKLVDQDVVKPDFWTYDVAAANKLLDSIGAKKGKDGIRSLKDGTRLGPWNIECPYGWSDWNASLEIVMQSAKKIGIELRTKFPEAPVWTNDMQTGNFDIIMNTPAGSLSPSQPWNRARTIMLSEGVPPIGEVAYYNWGRFKDSRADELLKIIPTKSNPAELKKLYTELDAIYLKAVPTIPLMYRPALFYTVNESVWKGMPIQGDGSDIPPQILTDGSGIKGLYVIHH
jgi:peptide/nickel transport system substrate-binding protein